MGNNKPYSIARTAGTSVLIALYFVLVLWFLDPFFIHAKGGMSLSYYYLVLGLCSFSISLYIQFINIKIKNVKLSISAIYGMVLLNTVVGIALLIFSLFIAFSRYDLPFISLASVGFVVLLAALLPVAIGLIKEREKLLSPDVPSEEEAKEEVLTVQINVPWYNNKQHSSFNQSDVICMESSDNYVTVYFESKGSLEKEVIRTTLKKVENNLPQNSRIVRVHKSYLVNQDKVEKITGVSQAYKLRMHLMEVKVPVSRNFDVKTIEN